MAASITCIRGSSIAHWPRENLRNRHEHSVEHIRTKLATLDFVLSHLDYRYLETEAEKVDYFCKELSIERSVLPAKRYAGAIREKTTDRYFVDKFPMFFAPEPAGSSPVVSLSFVDAGLLSLASFDSHLFAYHSLFGAIPHVNFVYIATRPTQFEAARRLFLAMAPTVANPDPGAEGLRYFCYRHVWETKQFSELTTEQIECVNRGMKQFTDPRLESLFQPWLQGQITCDVVAEQFRKLAPKVEVSFRTELIDGQAALFEANLPFRDRTAMETEVKGSPSTFRAGFQSAFGMAAEQTEEKPQDAEK